MDSQQAADFRSTSIERLRAKKRRVRYRHTNMAELGKPMGIKDEIAYINNEASYNVWNDQNKYKMRPYIFNTPYIRPVNRKLNWQDDLVTDSDQQSFFLDDKHILDGVTYSYDKVRGPNGGSQVFAQALGAAIEKLETQQFQELIKEYEIVDSSSSDDEYELV